MEQKKEIEVLWTGGFDSSFRVCQLSRMDVIITPYYLCNNRPSEPNELNAMNTIRTKLLNDPRTKATINPLVYVPVESRKTNEAVSDAYRRLRQVEYMGTQYEFLGVFALDHEEIELMVTGGGRIKTIIEKHGALKEVKDEYGDYYIVDKENSEPDICELFGHYHFPVMAYTKPEMKKKYIEMGLEDIINDTWFCFVPINGKPCGICNPCRCTIEEGMIERFSDAAIRRYILAKNANKKQEES